MLVQNQRKYKIWQDLNSELKRTLRKLRKQYQIQTEKRISTNLLIKEGKNTDNGRSYKKFMSQHHVIPNRQQIKGLILQETIK